MSDKSNVTLRSLFAAFDAGDAQGRELGATLDSYKGPLGGAVDMPINAACYILTNGGDALANTPDREGLNDKTLPMLFDRVLQAMRAFRETAHYPPLQVRDGVCTWLATYGIHVRP